MLFVFARVDMQKRAVPSGCPSPWESIAGTSKVRFRGAAAVLKNCNLLLAGRLDCSTH